MFPLMCGCVQVCLDVIHVCGCWCGCVGVPRSVCASVGLTRSAYSFSV